MVETFKSLFLNNITVILGFICVSGVTFWLTRFHFKLDKKQDLLHRESALKEEMKSNTEFIYYHTKYQRCPLLTEAYKSCSELSDLFERDEFLKYRELFQDIHKYNYLISQVEKDREAFRSENEIEIDRQIANIKQKLEKFDFLHDLIKTILDKPRHNLDESTYKDLIKKYSELKIQSSSRDALSGPKSEEEIYGEGLMQYLKNKTEDPSVSLEANVPDKYKLVAKEYLEKIRPKSLEPQSRLLAAQRLLAERGMPNNMENTRDFLAGCLDIEAANYYSK